MNLFVLKNKAAGQTALLRHAHERSRMWIDHLFCNEQSSHTRSDTFSWLHILPWQTQKILHRPKSFIPNGSLSIKLRFWSLTAKSYESELQQQKPLSSIVFRL